MSYNRIILFSNYQFRLLYSIDSERVFLPNPRTIYGGELMAQALMAASKTVPKDFRPNSLHCYFHDRCKLISNAFCKNVSWDDFKPTEKLFNNDVVDYFRYNSLDFVYQSS
ncbi:unnamed protein product [Schistosoma margrebowiei]|uniref:Acyl-CoA thioesterase II domain-containing protein n=1 Tax=Schistosoma margrebowiei TaxID=48269 RepID=A0A183MAS5_9TREM|nr:unnamed protein product [Schistosoma margrebowiei]